jgi:hypothetical protein
MMLRRSGIVELVSAPTRCAIRMTLAAPKGSRRSLDLRLRKQSGQ